MTRTKFGRGKFLSFTKLFVLKRLGFHDTYLTPVFRGKLVRVTKWHEIGIRARHETREPRAGRGRRSGKRLLEAMTMRSQLRSLWILSLLLLLPATAQAQGFIVVDDDRYHPPHVRRIWPRYFPLQIKSHRVDTDLTGSLARTNIDQVFYNPNPIQMEGTYIFPIPAGAVFDELRLTINGKEVAGEILDRDKARQIYEGIVRKMRDPALVEFMDGGMFKARIYPIPARGDTRVKLQYSQILPREVSLREYRYPLKTQRFTSAPIETLSMTCRIETSQDLNNI